MNCIQNTKKKVNFEKNMYKSSFLPILKLLFQDLTTKCGSTHPQKPIH